MFANIHYSYSVFLSYYTFGVLVLGAIASLHAPKIAPAMKLIGLLGLLTFNVSSVFMAEAGFPRMLETSAEILELLRGILLSWLPWAIVDIFSSFLGVGLRRLRNFTLFYGITLNILHLLAALFPASRSGGAVDILFIFTYLVLAVFSVVVPLAAIRMGIRNTLESGVRHWYRSTTKSLLFCACGQILAFIPLYVSYFPLPDNWAGINSQADISASGISGLNFMPLYYLFFTLPFVIHLLYILWKTSRFRLENEVETAVQSGVEGAETAVQSGVEGGDYLSPEVLDAFSARYHLSKREREVLLELLRGYSYAAIGEHLYISLATVKSHIYSIYRKTTVKNKMQLLRRILNR
ncbi:MAG: LuxR C-terminal-related transcriptional regulator [Spirochaetota bacterium]